MNCNYCGTYFSGAQEHCNNCGAAPREKGIESIYGDGSKLAWFGLIVGLITAVINHNIISSFFGLLGFFLCLVALIMNGKSSIPGHLTK